MDTLRRRQFISKFLTEQFLIVNSYSILINAIYIWNLPIVVAKPILELSAEEEAAQPDLGSGSSLGAEGL